MRHSVLISLLVLGLSVSLQSRLPAQSFENPMMRPNAESRDGMLWQHEHMPKLPPKARKFMRAMSNDKIRAAFEAKMTSEDRTVFETAIQNLMRKRDQGTAAWEKLRADYKAHDSLAVDKDRAVLGSLWQEALPDMQTVKRLADKYERELKALRDELRNRFPNGDWGNATPPKRMTGVYPNPLSLSSDRGAQLRYEAKAGSTVRVTITDEQGRTVQETVINNILESGPHTATIVTGETPLKAGTYIIHIQSGSDVTTQKLQVVK